MYLIMWFLLYLSLLFSTLVQSQEKLPFERNLIEAEFTSFIDEMNKIHIKIRNDLPVFIESVVQAVKITNNGLNNEELCFDIGQEFRKKLDDIKNVDSCFEDQKDNITHFCNELIIEGAKCGETTLFDIKELRDTVHELTAIADDFTIKIEKHKEKCPNEKSQCMLDILAPNRGKLETIKRRTYFHISTIKQIESGYKTCTNYLYTNMKKVEIDILENIKICVGE